MTALQHFRHVAHTCFALSHSQPRSVFGCSGQPGSEDSLPTAAGVPLVRREKRVCLLHFLHSEAQRLDPEFCDVDQSIGQHFVRECKDLVIANNAAVAAGRSAGGVRVTTGVLARRTRLGQLLN